MMRQAQASTTQQLQYAPQQHDNLHSFSGLHQAQTIKQHYADNNNISASPSFDDTNISEMKTRRSSERKQMPWQELSSRREATSFLEA
jgi:hypothetical protein